MIRKIGQAFVLDTAHTTYAFSILPGDIRSICITGELFISNIRMILKFLWKSMCLHREM